MATETTSGTTSIKEAVELLLAQRDDIKEIVDYCKEWIAGPDGSSVTNPVTGETVESLPTQLEKLLNDYPLNTIAKLLYSIAEGIEQDNILYIPAGETSATSAGEYFILNGDDYKLYKWENPVAGNITIGTDYNGGEKTITSTSGTDVIVDIKPTIKTNDVIGSYKGKYVYNHLGQKYYVPVYMADGTEVSDTSVLTSTIDNGIATISSGGSEKTLILFSLFADDDRVTSKSIWLSIYNGYSPTLMNAQDVINTAWRNNIAVIVPDNIYYVSERCLASTKNTMLGIADKYGASTLKAAPTYFGTIIDTLNWDLLKNNNVVTLFPDPDDDSYIAPCPYGIKIKGITVLGNFTENTTTRTQGDGFGARLYGKDLDLSITAEKTCNMGVWTFLPSSGTDDGQVSLTNVEGVTVGRGRDYPLIEVFTANTGAEGFVFDGPQDATLGKISTTGSASTEIGENLNIDSLEYPSSGATTDDDYKGCPGLNIRKSCHMTDFINAFWNRNGWACYLDKNAADSSLRLEHGGHLQVDSSRGGLFVGESTRIILNSIFTVRMNPAGDNSWPSLRCLSIIGLKCPVVDTKVLNTDYAAEVPVYDIRGRNSELGLSIYASKNVGDGLHLEGAFHNIKVNFRDLKHTSTNATHGLKDKSTNSIISGSIDGCDVTLLLEHIDSSNSQYGSYVTGNHYDLVTRGTGGYFDHILGIEELAYNELGTLGISFRNSSEPEFLYRSQVMQTQTLSLSSDATGTIDIPHRCIYQIKKPYLKVDITTISGDEPTVNTLKINAVANYGTTIEYDLSGITQASEYLITLRNV